MQILIDRLECPWGIQEQVGTLARAMNLEGRDVSIHTQSFDGDVFRDLKNVVHTHASPWKQLEPGRTTLVGPYPATNWIGRSPIDDYSILLTDVPWGLYPKQQEEWLGAMPNYVSGSKRLIKESLKYLIRTPVRASRRFYNRFRHNRAMNRAESIYIYDQRLREPLKAIHNRRGQLIPPVMAEPRENKQTPRNYFLAVAPYEPDRNLHAVIDAFYLAVRRYGARFQADWEADRPFGSGSLQDFQLKLVGDGRGRDYLEDYAETQQLGDRVEFEPWPSPERMERIIHSALAVVDVPLTADASVIPYKALAGGVPTVYSRSHPGLDSFVEHHEQSLQVKPSDRDAMARFMIDAAHVPPDQRTSVPEITDALSPVENLSTFD